MSQAAPAARDGSGYTRELIWRFVNEGDLREAIRKPQAYLETQPEHQEKIVRPKEQEQAENKHTDKKWTK